MLGSRTRRLMAATVLLWGAQASGLSAQTSDAAPQSDSVVVTGRSPERTQAFVEQLAGAPQTADQLARWDNEICTSIVGLPVRQGQFLADRIAQRAHAVGLSPGAAGCRANVAVFVSADSNATARSLYEQDPLLFAVRPENNVTTLGPAAFDDFLDAPRAVRWWHVAETVSADGLSLRGDASSGGISNAPVARSGGSRLYNDTRQDLARVIIIVDAQRASGVQLSALADYVSMVALAQIDPHADAAAFPTIMNLFSDAASTDQQGLTAMTDWDLGFLQGLYGATRNASNVQQQQREIARRISSSGSGGGSL